jgi:malto-oligosyltrehalose trehalohydrolase
MVNPESVAAAELHRYLGAVPISQSKTRFCVWSPTCDRVQVDLVDQDRVVALDRVAGGYHVAEIDDAPAQTQYLYQLQSRRGETVSRPDPASRFQPRGVHGPSEVVASDADRWSDGAWKGVAREDLVIYELHVGAFTEQGTFGSAIGRLDELVDLGVTAIELMPVAEAAGRWNWGYDGVSLFAPNHHYGTPQELRQLVDAAHARGLSVILDVVYNHLGPEGNYLGDFGPYLSSTHHTVWGAAPNFDDPIHGPALRRFFIANAVHWFDEYHIDALRVDAIHCMRDDSERHIAVEISQAVKDWASGRDRRGLLIAESNVYDPNMLAAIDEGGVGFDAEWCDDFLHSVFAVVRPADQLSHRPYRSKRDLDQTLKFGYVYEGSLRGERGRQQPATRVDTSCLVYSIQHHDCIGNHPLGRRLHQITSLETQRAAATLLFLCPAIPMQFMGEEFACSRPFQFFVDFTDDHLRQAVVEGRRREYPQHDWSGGVLPIDPKAFENSKIGPAGEGNGEMRRWYQELIALRKQWRLSGLLSDSGLSVETDLELGLFVLRYQAHGVTASVAVRLNADPSGVAVCRRRLPGAVLLDSCAGQTPVDEFLPNHAKVLLACASS